jgi:3-deoxy-manno-octulosonate cytidylyltransferase (CMP-KDO synthetase)
MKTAIIIPARLGSTRLPQKPLRMIAGMSLIERVYRQCKKAQGIDAVMIATDSDKIAKHVNNFGAGAIMTPEDCANGSERVFYAAKHLSEDFEIIINVQGDEPLIEPSVIEQLAAAFEDEDVMIATPISPIKEKANIENEHIVKTVTDARNNILYFSRSVIPFRKDKDNIPYWRHIGLYAFRRKILEEIRHLAKTELEESESLEQLRWLYHGYKIRAIQVENVSIEVNTEEDIEKVESMLKGKLSGLTNFKN